MPDLSLEGTHRFWCDYDRKILYRIVTSMESVESWSVDSLKGVDELVTYLGRLLDECDDVSRVDNKTAVKMLSNIHASRAFRIMQHLDLLKPGTAAQFLAWAEEQGKGSASPYPYTEVFLRRNVAFERLQLLARIFGPERINLIMKALESAE